MRALYCAHLMGVAIACTKLLQLPPVGVVLGRDIRFIMALPPGLIRFAGMMFPGKAWPVRGSIGLPSVHPAIPGPLKSPFRSASVGTNEVRTSLRLSLFFSYEKKKWSLSLTMGPPSV